jgi:hypothetical protein
VPIVGVDHKGLMFRYSGFADQRFGEPMLMLHIVEAVAALDTQAT